MRLRTLIVFGAGYIWGARTGHDRLAELTDRVRDLVESDLVQDYLQRVQGAAPSDDDEGAGTEAADAAEPGPDEEPEGMEEPEDAEFDEPPESEDDADGEPERTRTRTNVRRRAPGRTRR